ncbi:MAG: TatD family hydrolase [Verrucomicrobia bacterium]|nr:TatD family hydrolase [Verrucomicrobiota bacterium]
MDALIQRSRTAGVSRWITIGTSLEDWELYRGLAATYKDVHWTVGLHPGSVDETWEDQVKTIASYFATDPVPVAMGEVGLDFFHLSKYPDEAAETRRLQQQAFRAQLGLAYQLDCPLVVHSRGAFRECVQMIDDSGVDWRRVVFHCFTEGPEEIQMLIDRGGYASFTGILTYRNADKIRAAAKLQGLERLILETDAPYLSPEPVRGTTNESAHLRHLAEFCAQLFNVPLTEVARASIRSTRNLFFGEQ